jgi:hypothetical protein
VSNWDDSARRFKFHGSESEADATDPDASRAARSSPSSSPAARRLNCILGYAGSGLRQMMRGRFASVEPNYPASGRPVLTASALNVLQRLRKKPYSSAWENKTPSEIAAGIARLRDGRARRFPVPVDVDPGAGTEEADPLSGASGAARHRLPAESGAPIWL